MSSPVALMARSAGPDRARDTTDTYDRRPLNPGGRVGSHGDEMAIRMRRGRYGISGVAASYGLGLFNFADGSFGHTGTIESTHAMVVARPDRITWALMVNGEYPGDTSDLKSIVDNALDIAFD